MHVEHTEYMPEYMLLTVLIFGTALLYSSVGQTGTGGCVAALALFGLTPAVMKPAALTFNMMVGAMATWQLYMARAVSWRSLLPFALSAVPFAFLGGTLTLSDAMYYGVVGVTLLFAALPLFADQQQRPSTPKPLPMLLAVVCSVGIGFLSGVTGVGSGILLSPLLVFVGEPDTRKSAGVLAVFILTTAVAGLIGHLISVPSLPSVLPYWVGAVGLGVIAGSEFGGRRLGTLTLRHWLALVLVIAGVKLLLS